MLSLVTADTYEANRGAIKSGDLIAFQSNSWLGKIVRAWTGSSYSHIGVAWVVSGRVFVLEAMDGIGVRIMPLSNRLPFYVIKSGVKWTKDREKFALSKVGQPYSYLDAIRGGFGLYPSGNGWQCVEYVSQVTGLIPVRYDPESIVNLVLEKGA